MLVNVGLFVGVSLLTSQSIIERSQAVQFVDIFKRAADHGRVWRGRATVGDLRQLLVRFIGAARAHAAFTRLAARADGSCMTRVRPIPRSSPTRSGSLPARSARPPPASWSRRCCARRCADIDEVVQILDEASQLVVYSRELEQKSRALEAATADLRAANERLKQLDRMKDDFVATVSHEVRTPLTSIRSFSEILRDNPDLDPDQRREFITIIVQESERLSRLINDILDLAKMEAGTSDWHMANLAPKAAIESRRRQRRPVSQDAPRRARNPDPEDLPEVRADARPADAGDREPDVQCGEILRRARRPDPAGRMARGRHSCAST